MLCTGCVVLTNYFFVSTGVLSRYFFVVYNIHARALSFEV